MLYHCCTWVQSSTLCLYKALQHVAILGILAYLFVPYLKRVKSEEVQVTCGLCSPQPQGRQLANLHTLQYFTSALVAG